ncbi:hypothetical protein [Micromonospora sp. DT233]|uniref:hypothetical protein n=1 Tax=Micromonospora sp. DT233 TaxID=3393432 RepID=UPI003CED687C
MRYRWLGNTPRGRYEDGTPPPTVGGPDDPRRADDPDDPRRADGPSWPDDEQELAAGATGRRTRNRSHRWGRR